MNGFIDAMPFASKLGISISVATPELVEGSLPWASDLCTTATLMHGGAVMAFGDTLGAICAFLNLPAGSSTTTIESKTNFLRGVRSGEIRGECRPLHVGRRFIVVQTDIFDPDGKRVAQVTQTQAVLKPLNG